MKINMQLVKDHPVAATVTILFAGFVAYKILGGGSGSSGGMVVSSTGVDPQQAALQGQLALQGQQMSGQLQALGIQASTQVQLKQMDLQNAAMTAAYQYQIAQLQAGYEAQHDQLQAAVSTAQINAQLQAIQSQNDTLINQSKISAQSQIAAIQSAVQQTAIMSAQQIATQRAQSDAQVQIAQAQAQASMYGARQAAGVAKQGQTMSTIGMLGMMAMAFFCDVQIKTKLGCVNTADCLNAVKRLPLDKFVYIVDSAPSILGDDRIHVQTYAQDFYREIGAADFATRKRIDVVDMMGVMLGAIKELGAI